MSNVAVHIDPPAPANVVGANSIVQVIERAAKDPSVDVDKLERLLMLHERIRIADAEQAFNAAMKAAKADMPQVFRDAKNDTTHSRYARLETLARTVDPIIARHGFGLSFGTDVSPMEGHYRITCDLSHDAGHTKSYHLDIPADGVGMKGNANKTPTHALGSTISYGRRYLKLMIFDIATTDDDDGQAAGSGQILTVTGPQIQRLREMIAQSGKTEQEFCAFCCVDALADIPSDRFDKAVTVLQGRIADLQKNGGRP